MRLAAQAEDPPAPPPQQRVNANVHMTTALFAVGVLAYAAGARGQGAETLRRVSFFLAWFCGFAPAAWVLKLGLRAGALAVQDGAVHGVAGKL